MNTASRWAQIHYRVTGSERAGWAFHSDVCVPPKHSDLRQGAEDLVGKASLLLRLSCFHSRDYIL